ncbi:MAG: WxcM-like domain-containing protein [Myxococcales bacterium]|nr:WxcM-like domain-containing protein [Myxococcales bacterium]
MVMNDIQVFDLFKHEDERGFLLKAVQKAYTDERPFGEIYFVSASSGTVRANHFHKVTTEWFVVVRGEGVLTLADAEFPNKRRTIPMGGCHQVCVKIPPGVAHAICSVGTEDLLMMALADKPYDPKDTDTFPLEIA